MKTKLKYICLIAAVLALSLLLTGTAFAEGEEPPAPAEAVPAEEAAPPPEPPPEEPVLIEAPPAEEAPLVEEPLLIEEPVIPPPEGEVPPEPVLIEDSAPVGEVATTEGVVPEDTAPADGAVPGENLPAEPPPLEEPLVEQASAEPDVILVDTEGQPLDTASQESVNLLASGDPYWISGGNKWASVSSSALCPVDAVVCYVSSTPIQTAITKIADGYAPYPSDGIIHVEYGVYPDLVVMDGSNANVNHITTLLGHDNGYGVYPTVAKMTISNMTLGFTLNGFTVTGGVFISDSDGAFIVQNVTAPLNITDVNADLKSGTGIYVSNHKGNVTLTRVNANGNTGTGVYIENLRGGTITVNNGVTDLLLDPPYTFNGNTGGDGLEIYSLGAVVLNYVTANSNISAGIYVGTTGAVTMTAVKAVGNTGPGVLVETPLGLVTITNGVADDNGYNGFSITSKGATLRNIAAVNNSNYGIELYLTGGAALLENVKANDNGAGGIFIDHSDNIITPVTMRYLVANGNGGAGIHVESLGAVAVTYSMTHNNDWDGLYIATRGVVTLTTIMASWNGYCGLVVEGIYIDSDIGGGNWQTTGMYSPASITLTSPADPNFANTFDNNGWQEHMYAGSDGIRIISQLPVTLRNFSSSWHTGGDSVTAYGVRVEGPVLYDLALGDYVLKRAGMVTIATTIPDWRNSVDHNDFGIFVYSSAAVTINGLDSSENDYALCVETLGAITLANMSDWRSGEFGSVALNNYDTTGAAYLPVTITNLEIRESSSDPALYVGSRGRITITNLWLEKNAYTSAVLDNQTKDGRGAATITNATIRNNNIMGNLSFYAVGIYVNVIGAITFTNVSVTDNFGTGAELHNWYVPAPLVFPITLTDCVFNNNHGNGVEVYSRGLITLRGVESQRNYIRNWVTEEGETVYERNDNNPDWGGVDQWEFEHTSSGSVTIILRSSEFEPVVTLVDSLGNPVGMNYGNDEDGVFTARYDTLTQYETYTIFVDYDGIVSDGWGRYSLSVNDDNETNPYIPAMGMILNNDLAGGTAGVTMTATASLPFNQFNGNNSNGLYILSKGAISLTNLNASDSNWGDGVHAQNPDSLGAVTVQSTITGQPGWFGNNTTGIFVQTRGAITLGNVESSDNRASGAELDNASCSEWDDSAKEWINCDGTGAVTVKAISGWHNQFNNNQLFGLFINSRGAVLLTNIRANNNGLDGAMIRNTRGATIPANPVTVNTAGALRNEFNGNGWNWQLIENDDGFDINYYGMGCNGMSIVSGGAITVLNLEAHSNDGGLMLRNNNATTPRTVTITNADANDNNWAGVWVASKGAITLTNVNANNNHSEAGIALDNTYGTVASPVTLTDCEINGNHGDGLKVWSKGLITLKGVQTQWSYTRWGYLEGAENGITVYENNQPEWEGGEDSWQFHYDGPTTNLVITLRGYGLYYPIVVLVDSSDTEITDTSHDFTDNVWTSTFNYGKLTPDEDYRILVRWDGTESDGWGTYSLSVNDIDEAYPNFPSSGTRLDNSAGTTAGVTILATAKHPFNEFSENNAYGLLITSNGPVSITNPNAGRNTFCDGVHIESRGTVLLQSTNIYSPAWLSENGLNGLYIRTRSAITLKNIQANGNWAFGADLDNAACTWDTPSQSWINCAGTGGITLQAFSGYHNQFNKNGYSGLWAVSRGAITLSNVQASTNGWDGVFLWNDGRGAIAAITVNTVGAVRNDFTDNALKVDYAPWFPDGDKPLGWMVDSDYYWCRYNGLTAMAGGAISILNSDVSWNRNGVGGGIVAINDLATTAAPVLVSNTNAQGNEWNGLYVRSKGAITLAAMNVTENGEGGGIYLKNDYCYYDGVLMKQVCPTPGTVTMTNLNIDNNGGIGLYVDSLGAIRLTGANISNNRGPGIDMANDLCEWGDPDWVCPLALNGITMSNITANNNQGSGLEAYSRGLITLTNGFASGNWNFGFYLTNRDRPGSTAGIMLSNLQAHNNGNTGISAETSGALTMSNIRATNNSKTGGGMWVDDSGDGMSVQDYYNEKFGPDHWYFEADSGSPYHFTLLADVAWGLNRIAFDPWIELYHVDHDTGEDTQLDISDPLHMVSMLQCVDYDFCQFIFDPTHFGYSGTETFVVKLGSSSGDGFYRLSLNDPTPDDIDQMFWVNGLGFQAGGNVTLTGINTFQNNSLAGIIGTTPGNITLYSVGAKDNGTEGIYVDNCMDSGSGCTGTGNVLIAGNNIANNNGWEGLRITTNGTVSVSNLDASYNNHRCEDQLRSIYIEAFGTGKAVNLTNVNAQHNKGNGIQLNVHGITTFNNVHSWMNGWDGVWIDSHGYTINLVNFCWFMFNANYGFMYNIPAPTIITTNTIFWANGGGDYGPDLPA